MNRSKLTRLFAGFTAALLTAGTLSLGVFAVPAQEDTQIRIFHTNDVHSRYDASVNDDGTLSGFGYARMKTLVDTYSQGVDKTLVFDAGDTFHGQPFATLNRGLSIAQLMDVVGYDAVVAGNHDFNYGASRTPTLARYAGATLLGANVLNKDTGTVLKGFTANKMYRVGDVKIGVFGLSTPETAYKTNPLNVKQVKFADPVSTAKKQVQALEERGADVIICIAHLGIDQESGTAVSTNVAAKVDGIDLIIDGHSHSTPNEYQPVNGTVIVSCGEYMAYLGMVDITVAPDGTVTVESNPLKASDYTADEIAPDAAVQAKIDAIKKGQESKLGQVVATTPVALDGERAHVRTGETNLSRLITSAMLAETGADVALTNGGGIRASIDQGPITVGEVQNVLPFGNYIVTIKLTGKDLRAAVEHGLPGYQADGTLEQLGRMSQFAGMEVSYDPARPQGSRILSITVNGKPLSETQTYLVATNDFMSVGGDDYTMLNKPVVNEFCALDEAVINYLNDSGSEALEQAEEAVRLAAA